MAEGQPEPLKALAAILGIGVRSLYGHEEILSARPRNVVGYVFHLDNLEKSSEYGAMSHPHSGIIEALGGHEVVAEKLAAVTADTPNSEAVRKWRRNGVPWRWRGVVAKIARKHRVAVPRGFSGIEERQERAS